MAELRLGVNVDHVATVRNARGGAVPDPVRAALLAIEAGADGITAHLREDRRHIHDDDMRRLKAAISKPLNFEMAATEAMLDMALSVRPHACCLVPENRTERTTEGGLDVVGGFQPPQAVRRRARPRRRARVAVHRALDRGARRRRRPCARRWSSCTPAPGATRWRARSASAAITNSAGCGSPRRSALRSASNATPATASITTPRGRSRPCRRSSSSTSAISWSARRSSSASPKACADARGDGGRAEPGEVRGAGEPFSPFTGRRLG